MTDKTRKRKRPEWLTVELTSKHDWFGHKDAIKEDSKYIVLHYDWKEWQIESMDVISTKKYISIKGGLYPERDSWETKQETHQALANSAIFLENRTFHEETRLKREVNVSVGTMLLEFWHLTGVGPDELVIRRADDPLLTVLQVFDLIYKTRLPSQFKLEAKTGENPDIPLKTIGDVFLWWCDMIFVSHYDQDSRQYKDTRIDFKEQEGKWWSYPPPKLEAIALIKPEMKQGEFIWFAYPDCVGLGLEDLGAKELRRQEEQLEIEAEKRYESGESPEEVSKAIDAKYEAICRDVCSYRWSYGR